MRSFESGSRLVRYLVTVRSETPRRRVDVVPVTLWDPEDALIESAPQAGDEVYIAGSVQRRFWTQDEGRHSRLEVVAQAVEVRDPANAQ